MANSAAKAAKQRRKELAKRSKEASKRRKQMLKESQLSDKAKERKAKKAAQGAGGIKLAIAKAFPTFASALKVKPADVEVDRQSRPKKEFQGRTPSVNLLPPEYTIDRAVASMRRSFTIAGVGIVGALGVVYFAQGAVTNIATQALTSAQLQTVEANQRIAEFSDVTQIYDELSRRLRIIESVENNRPEYFAALTELYALAPSDVTITSVSVENISRRMPSSAEEGTAPIADRCGPPVDPFRQDLRPVSACISFTGTTNSVDGVYRLMEAYYTSILFSNVVVEATEAVGRNGLVGFSATGAILAEADVAKILVDSSADLTGEVSFGDGSETTLNESPDPNLSYVAGEFTLNENYDLLDSNGNVVATISDYSIISDNIAYVTYNNQNYLLDAAGKDVLRGLLSGSSNDGLLEPIDPSDPSVNGYIIDAETNDIIEPFTLEVIAASGTWSYREVSDAYIVTSTGQPLEMADIYYQWYREGNN